MKREYGVDLVKIMAAALVIVVHQFMVLGFYDIQYSGGKMMLLMTSIYVISLSCVPLFLIVSGYLMSGKKIELSYYKKILYFLIEVLLIYILIIAARLLFISGNFTIKLLILSTIKAMLAPAYYVGLYFSLYLIAPFLNKLFFSLNDNERKLFMGLLIFTISLPTLLNINVHVNFFAPNATSIYPVLYYFLGVYIKEYQPKIKKSVNILLIGIASFAYGLSISYGLYGKTYVHYFG